ncbi:NBR1-Ig-like domain-containing protein [Spirillospora sp. NPDC048911]|uniref:NBR1-Ig-like domain-containing protein n=1 Tax=Spirillospora sp. NPDC048911 TaxID=3364527 RepID=UPI0037111EB8
MSSAVDQGKDGGRRGRRSRRPDPSSGPVAGLAERLWRLKQEAGDPSYAEMAALGAAASKSSLAAAAQGRNLPTWGTTWEFVRVLAVDRLGHDPEATEREWRAHWQKARDAVTAAEDAEEFGESNGEAAAGPSPTRTTAEMVLPNVGMDEYRRPVDDLTGAHARIVHMGSPLPSPRRFPLGLIAAAAAAALVVAGGVTYLAWPEDKVAPKNVTASGPVKNSPDTTTQINEIPQDDSQFVGDITYPDGTRVKAGATFEKVWRLRNSGKVHWKGRKMVRLGSGPCAAPKSVPVPSTPPGQLVDIHVRVRASQRPTRCKIYWKMHDASGRVTMPTKRPIFLDVQVVSA